MPEPMALGEDENNGGGEKSYTLHSFVPLAGIFAPRCRLPPVLVEVSISIPHYLNLWPISIMLPQVGREKKYAGVPSARQLR